MKKKSTIAGLATALVAGIVYVAIPPKEPPTIKYRWDVDQYLVANKISYCTEWWGSTNLKHWTLRFEVYNTNFLAIPITNDCEFFIRRIRFTNIINQVQYSDWSRNPK